jgi:hypothetical protein
MARMAALVVTDVCFLSLAFIVWFVNLEKLKGQGLLG